MDATWISREPIPADGRDLQTICVLCNHNCGIRVDVEDSRITAVRPDKDNVHTHGYVCHKSVTVPRHVHHDQRVTTPLKRNAKGGFDEIEWDQAIAEIAQQLAATRNNFGSDAIGMVGVGGQGNQLDGHLALTLLSALGSKRWFCAWAQEKHQHSLISHWLFDSAPTMAVHADLERTTYHVLIGTNPKISNMGHNPNETLRNMARGDEVTLVVVDPRVTESSKLADEHVHLNPGSDVWFLLGLIGHIVQAGLADSDFIAQRVGDWQAFEGAIAHVDVDIMAERCGVPASQIQRIAKGYASAQGASLKHDLGCEQTPFSTVIAYLLQVLAVITGNIGRDGGSVFTGVMKPPVLPPDRFDEPTRSIAAGIRAIRSFGFMEMFSPTLIPEDVLVDDPARLRALIVQGANPWLTYSDTKQWNRARKKLDLLVVVDPAMTETALQADYVLSAPTGYEKWEWSDFVKGYPSVKTQVRKPVLPAQGKMMPEPEIYARLMEALELVPEPSQALRELSNGALTATGAKRFLRQAKQESKGNAAAEQVWIYRLVGPQLPAPGLVSVWQMCFYNAATRREAVIATLGQEWADKDYSELGRELWRRIETHPEGVEIARLDRATNLEDNLNWPDGKIRLLPDGIVAQLQRAIATERHTSEEFPFTLSAGLRTRWTMNTQHRDPAWRSGKKGSACTLHMAADDLQRLGLSEGQVATLSTAVGSASIPVETDDNVHSGHAWVPNGYGMVKPGTDPNSGERDGVNLNELTDARDRDPISGCPHHKAMRCRIEAA